MPQQKKPASGKPLTKKPVYKNWEAMPVLLRADELAYLLDGDLDTTRKYIRAGQIPGAKKINGKWLVDKETLRRFFEGEQAPPHISDADAQRIAALMAKELIKAGLRA